MNKPRGGLDLVETDGFHPSSSSRRGGGTRGGKGSVFCLFRSGALREYVAGFEVRHPFSLVSASTSFAAGAIDQPRRLLQRAVREARMECRPLVVLLAISYAPVFNLRRREALFSLPDAGKVVVGDGGLSISDEVADCSRIRLLSLVVIWGPVCKMGGLSCNFHFLWGPLCSVVTLLMI